MIEMPNADNGEVSYLGCRRNNGTKAEYNERANLREERGQHLPARRLLLCSACCVEREASSSRRSADCPGQLVNRFGLELLTAAWPVGQFFRDSSR
jgi:hypothetical protein